MFCLYSRQGNFRGATALLAIVGGIFAVTSVASAQMYPQYSPAPQYGYNTAGGWVIPVQAHGYAPGYCPCPPGVPMYGEPAPLGDYGMPLTEPAPIDGEGTGTGTDGTDDSPQPAPVEDMPNIADLSGDVSYGSAPQSAVPNAIGDSFGPCGLLIMDDLIDPLLIGVCGGGDRFKATHNNSAVPQTRVFFNYNRYNNALGGEIDGGIQAIDVQRSELGYEVADCCNLVSVMLNVPFSHTMESTYVENDFSNIPTGMEMGNVSVSLKRVLYQSCYRTISTGVALTIPTANDVIIRDDDLQFYLRNETVVVSPYVAFLNEHSPHVFSQGFIQLGRPLNDSEGRADFLTAKECNPFEIREPTQLYIDLSLGAWLYRDCCGNGVAAIGELHYTTELDSPDFVEFDNLVTGEFIGYEYFNRDILNTTVGLTVIRNCWDFTFAYAAPLNDGLDRTFEGELIMQVNRRY